MHQLRCRSTALYKVISMVILSTTIMMGLSFIGNISNDLPNQGHQIAYHFAQLTTKTSEKLVAIVLHKGGDTLKVIKSIREDSDIKDKVVLITTDIGGLLPLKKYFGHNLVGIKCSHLSSGLKFSQLRQVGSMYFMDSKSIKRCHLNWTDYSIIGIKNAAYMAAIQFGVASIIEIESVVPKNFSNFKHLILNPDCAQKLSNFVAYSHSGVTMNPYVLFNAKVPELSSLYAAHPNLRVQPPGRPLEDMKANVIPTLHATALLKPPAHINQTFKVGIIQSLIDNWPHMSKDDPLACQQQFNFQSKLPNVNVHPTQFTPLNERATLYKRDTFWALFLPLSGSANSHSSTIWRGYIAQTLMRCTGRLVRIDLPMFESAKLCTANQRWRISDQTATKTLLSTLQTFQCSSDSETNPKITLPYCMTKLYQKLYYLKLIQKDDVNKLYAWLETLDELGFVFPDINPNLCQPSDESMNFTSKGMLQLSPPAHPGNLLRIYSMFRPQAPRSYTAALAVHMNHRHIEVIPLWLSIYQYISPSRVVFYSPAAQPCHSTATRYLICNVSDDAIGNFEYESIMDLMERYPDYATYVSIHDDVVLNPLLYQSALVTKESAVTKVSVRSKLCVTKKDGNITINKPWDTWRGGLLVKPMQEMWKDGVLSKLFSNFSKHCPITEKEMSMYKGFQSHTDGIGTQSSCMKGIGPHYDMVVVSAKDKDLFLKIMKIYRKYKVFLEMALPWTLKCVLGAAKTINNTLHMSTTYKIHLHSRDHMKASNFCKNVGVGAYSVAKLHYGRLYPQPIDFHVLHPVKTSTNPMPALVFRDCFTGADNS